MTDPFDTVREALYAATRGPDLSLAPVPGTPVGDAHLALASIEERLRLVESLERQANNKSQFEFDRAEAAEEYAKEGWVWVDTALEALGAKSVFDIRDKNLSLPAAERERDALQHIIDCADTPLMRDVLEAKLSAEQRVAELEEALREIIEEFRLGVNKDGTHGGYDEDDPVVIIARRALETEEE